MEKILEIFPKEEKYTFTSSSVTTILRCPAVFLRVHTFNLSSWRNSGIPTFNSSLALTVDTETYNI